MKNTYVSPTLEEIFFKTEDILDASAPGDAVIDPPYKKDGAVEIGSVNLF